MSKSTFPASWKRILQENLPFYKRIPREFRATFHEMIQGFLEQVSFVGEKKFEVTDEVRVVVAGLAVRPLLFLGLKSIAHLKTIVMHPAVVEDDVAGRAWSGGTMELGWEWVQFGMRDEDDAFEVVVHEIAHFLDYPGLDGTADGIPSQGNDCNDLEPLLRQLYKAMTCNAKKESERQRRMQAFFRDYAQTKLSEFFACSVECFFEQGEVMRGLVPELYDAYVHYFGYDPLEWFVEADPEEDAQPEKDVEEEQEREEEERVPFSSFDHAATEEMLSATREGLERLRTRLLDLTFRNRLLHLRPTLRSALHVIDELPDVLYKRLRNEEPLHFLPIPYPTLTDYPAKVEELRASVLEGYEQQGFPPPEEVDLNREVLRRLHKDIKAKQHAKKLGFETSFEELPEHSEDKRSLPGKHKDANIQTLLYPDALESSLRNLQGLARTAMEETGANTLHLAFGFLEWYEHNTSEKVRLSPLVLVPAQLVRGDMDKATHCYTFALTSMKGEQTPNLSLREKLRREFGLFMPRLEEDETPEAYFRKWEPILRAHPRWRLRRSITLSQFHFSKLLMYLDLDPDEWPPHADLAHHKLLHGLFAAPAEGGETFFGKDIHLDREPERASLVTLLSEADSSQHSALIDVVEGRNLVVEGPPGTGKSQTITNLIATVLKQGKTVLFVAEKLAALEVVYQRLEKLGLGSFALELHSHKTHKRAVLDSLDERLRQAGSFSPAEGLELLKEEAEDLRHQLESYADALHLDRRGGSFYEQVWCLHAARQALGERWASLLPVSAVAACRDNDLSHWEHKFHQLSVVAKQWNQFGDVTQHPWAEFSKADAAAQFAEVQTRLQAIDGSLAALSSRCDEFARSAERALPASQETFDWLASFRTALRPSGREMTRLYACFLRGEVTEDEAALFLRELTRYESQLAPLIAWFPEAGSWTKRDAESLEEIFANPHFALLQAHTLQGVEDLLRCAEDDLRWLSEHQTTLSLLASGLPLAEYSLEESLCLLEKVSELAEEAPLEALVWRPDNFSDPEFDRRVVELEQHWDNFLGCVKELKRAFAESQTTYKPWLAHLDTLEEEDLDFLLQSQEESLFACWAGLSQSHLQETRTYLPGERDFWRQAGASWDKRFGLFSLPFSLSSTQKAARLKEWALEAPVGWLTFHPLLGDADARRECRALRQRSTSLRTSYGALSEAWAAVQEGGALERLEALGEGWLVLCEEHDRHGLAQNLAELPPASFWGEALSTLEAGLWFRRWRARWKACVKKLLPWFPSFADWDLSMQTVAVKATLALAEGLEAWEEELRDEACLRGCGFDRDTPWEQLLEWLASCRLLLEASVPLRGDERERSLLSALEEQTASLVPSLRQGWASLGRSTEAFVAGLREWNKEASETRVGERGSPETLAELQAEMVTLAWFESGLALFPGEEEGRFLAAWETLEPVRLSLIGEGFLGELENAPCLHEKLQEYRASGMGFDEEALEKVEGQLGVFENLLSRYCELRNRLEWERPMEASRWQRLRQELPRFREWRAQLRDVSRPLERGWENHPLGKTLASMVRERRWLHVNPGLEEMWPALYEGLLTPIQSLSSLLQWKSQCERGLASSPAVRQWLLTAPLVSLRSFLELSEKGEWDRLRVAPEALGELVARWRLSTEAPAKTLLERTSELEQARDWIHSSRSFFVNRGASEELPLEKLPALFRQLTITLERRQALEESPLYARFLPTKPPLTTLDLGRLRGTLELWLEVHHHPTLPAEWKAWLRTDTFLDRCGQLHELSCAVEESLLGLEGDWERWLEWGQYPAEGSVAERRFLTHFEDCVSRVSEMLANLPLLPQWCSGLRLQSELRAAQLMPLFDLGVHHRLCAEDLSLAFRGRLAEENLTRVEVSALDLYSGDEHDRVQRRFGELDSQRMELEKVQLAHELDQREVPRGKKGRRVAEYTEVNLLLREIHKQRRHIPIRQLLRRSGKAIQALKPCFMMGPQSVAQYLEQGALHFDVIVMDEASQLRPEEALGAIARGAQLVVVGDSKQLPPTAFFQETEGEDIQEESIVEDAESVLDAVSGIFQPLRRLRWHYRSEDERLIGFSSEQFYNNDLITFPSPGPVDRKQGIFFHHIAEGTFQSGENVAEAEALVEAALHHLKAHPDETLGLVAMNKAQQERLQYTLDQRLKGVEWAGPVLDAYRERHEPLFVKNLENVQGDERDVIFLSMTYGPNEEGVLFQRFGPINYKDGWRRLNVLFTRSRRRMEVFSSMQASQIRVRPQSSRGVVALRDFLSYAESPPAEEASQSMGTGSFQEATLRGIVESLGLRLVPQVGRSEFRVDYAVFHPEHPKRALLGLMTDDRDYLDSLSVRDRDKLRPAVLRRLGWNVQWIWTAAWYHSFEQEKEKLLAALREATKELTASPGDEMQGVRPDESSENPSSSVSGV